MTALAHFFWTAFQWRFAMMCFVIPGATLVPFAITFLFSAPAFRWVRIGLISLLVGTFVMMLTMLTIGPMIVDSLIYTSGIAGSGVIIDEEQTSEMYNSQYVSRFSVLLKAGSGKVIESSFMESDFNVWPVNNLNRYPGVGQHFTTRYLPNHPNEFVIVSDDDSEYAKVLKCSDLKKTLAAADKRSKFAGDEPNVQRQLADAQRAAEAGGCNPASTWIKAERASHDEALNIQASIAARCPALIQAIKLATHKMTAAPRNLSLRREYFISVQDLNSAGCPYK